MKWIFLFVCLFAACSDLAKIKQQNEQIIEMLKNKNQTAEGK